MEHFNSNRFHIAADNTDEAASVLDKLSSDGTLSVQRADDAGDAVFHISGTGNLCYDRESVSEGIAKMTGNMDAFYTALQPLLRYDDAFILSMASIGEDGWISARSATVTNTGIEKSDLVGDAIKTAGKMLNNEYWTTDTHAIS